MANQNQKNNNITYRQLTKFDIGDAIRLHQALIPSAGARMGEPYLRRLYTTLLEHPTMHFVLAAFENNQLVGIMSATNDFTTTQRLLNKRFLTLIPMVLFGLVRNRYSLGELVSHVKVDSHMTKLFDKTTMYILNIAVDPSVQRQGIATQLINYIHTRWRIKTILVDTQKNNVNAQKFYKKIGFTPVTEVADSIIFRYRSIISS